jgi:uncharacterized membrane protein
MHKACALISIIAAALIALASGAVVAQSDCTAQLKQQEEQCRSLAEKRQEMCPSGEGAGCRQLSEQIASQCTRRPCGAAPKKASKARAKRARPKEQER